MNDEEGYLFDLWGYLVVENVLNNEEIVELKALLDQQTYPEPNNADIYSQRFGSFLEWENGAFRKSLNHLISKGTHR